MAEDLFSVWNPLVYDRREVIPNSAYLPTGAPLSERQKEALIELTRQTRITDLEYLNAHIEVRAIIREFIHELATECPFDVRKFGRKFFSRPKKELCHKIIKQVEDFKKVRGDMLADDSSTAPSSDSSKITSSFNLKEEKCIAISLSEVLGLPDYQPVVEPLEIPLTQSSSTSSETWDSSDFEHPKMEEGMEEGGFKCHDCHCLIK